MNKKVYEDFLRFVAFGEEETAAMLDEWIFACGQLGISEEDVAYAMEHYIPENWDIQYKGVRMIIGAVVRETIDLCKANRYKAEGKKIVYGILPATLTSYLEIGRAHV